MAADHVNVEETARRVSRRDVEAAIDAIAQARRVLIAGTDQMAFFASYLRHLLMLLDLQADLVASPSQESLSRLGRIDADTLVIGLSAGRPHPLVVRAMKLARHRKARTVAITDATLSEVAKLAQIAAVLLVQQPGLRAFAHRAAGPHPGACLRGLQPRRRAVRRPHQGLPAQVARTPGHPRSARYDGASMRDEATFRVKAGLAEMLKGGVIMDVVTPDQAKIAEDAGASAVMALERVPADIRRDGGVARMSDPSMIKEIQASVTIPVMAKARIGHFAEAQVLEALEVDYIDESEVLTPADDAHHIDKWAFRIPVVCGATNLGEALRRIAEGAAMIRSKGEAGTGDIVEAVRHLRTITGEIRRLTTLDEAELFAAAKELRAPHDLVRRVAQEGRLPVPLFCAGGIATPADASLVMQLGAEAVFVGSGIFKSEDPARRAAAIVEATTHFSDPLRVAQGLRGPRHRDVLARGAQARARADARRTRLVAAPAP